MKSLRVALPWVLFLGIGTWLSPLPGPAPDRAQPVPTLPPLDKAVVNQKLATLQMPFIANHGQRDPQVKFYAPTLSGTTFVTQTGELVYALPGQGPRSEVRGPKSEVQGPKSKVRAPQSRGGVVLRETLVGGRVQVITGEQEAVTKINSFHGNDPTQWRRNLSTYEAVSLGEVYAGVALTLKARGKSVEKLFSIQPGAAPEQIRVQVRGGKGLAVTGAGELAVETAEGAVHFSQPVAYQEGGGGRQAVEVAYVVEGDTYGFRVGTYDRERELVIDPILVATFLGGNGDAAFPITDTAFALALDGAGNVYVAGSTPSVNFPGVDAGSADSTFVHSGSLTDGEAFVARLDAGLSTILAATFLGGSGVGCCVETAVALALDSAGNVYVAGNTDSADFPGVDADSADPTFEGRSAFVAQLDASLSTLLAATFLGGTSSSAALALALDSAGNVYVAGRTHSTDFPGVDAGSADSTFGGFGPEAFVAKLDGNLSTVLAATFLGGSHGFEEATGLALDSAGNVYVAGETNSADFPGVDAGSADSTFDHEEAYVAKLDGDLGTILAATFLGGDSFERASGLALDSAGNVYVTGRTHSTDFPGVDAGSADNTFDDNEAFVAKLDAGLSTILAATFLGGSNRDAAYALALDSAGNVYVAGET